MKLDNIFASVKWDKIVSSIMAVFGSLATYLWGGWDMVLNTFVSFMILDYILGVMCGFKEKKLSSVTAFNGIFKKITMLIIVAVAVKIDIVFNAQGLIRNATLFFYISIEGISIIENSSRMGVPIPTKLKDALIQLKEGNKKEPPKEVSK